MDILIYCNGLNTRIYLNAKIENENEKNFTVIYGNNQKTIFDKNIYSYSIA